MSAIVEVTQKTYIDQNYLEISKSGLFDDNFYLAKYNDLVEKNIDPLLHYLEVGHKLSLDPHPLFDTAYYRKQASNIAQDDNPLLHFLQNGNRCRLSPHPYFDTNFYLSRYPDIKKGTQNALSHFVQHGGREYRWPNANFDPLYYLKIVPQAYAENFLIHYLRIGKDWQIPTCSVRISTFSTLIEILAQPFRIGLFTLLCFLYSLQRQPNISFDQKFSNYQFFAFSLRRFLKGMGLKIKLTKPEYLMQAKKLEPSESYLKNIFRAPASFASLYLANVFKVQGLFADAQFILERLTVKKEIANLAQTSLADLFLIQTLWSEEFEKYAKEGIVLNLIPQLTKWKHVPTWHSSKVDQVLTVLNKTIAADNKNAHAYWLLLYGLLADKRYSELLSTLKNCPASTCTNWERNFFNVRAKYGLNTQEGIRELNRLSPAPENDWYTASLKLVNTHDIPSTSTKEHVRIIEPNEQIIKSKTIHNLQIIHNQNTIKFASSYLSQFQDAQILPEYGIVAIDKNYLIKDSCHVKLCHASLFNSCLLEVTNSNALLFCAKPELFKEENCIYIGHNNNYYHWLIDELPRLLLIEKQQKFEDFPILVDNRITKWQYELFDILGIEKIRLRKLDFRRPFSFKNLIVPSRLSRDMIAHPEAVNFIRNKLLGHGANPSATKGKRVFVKRSANTSTGRTMINENIVIDKFKRANFIMIEPEQLAIKEQIEFFSDAEIIAGPTGAALTNILMAPKQARIISLGPVQSIGETYTSLACAIGQESWSIRGKSYPRPYPHWIWTNFDYEIDEKDIDLCFDHTL